MAEIKPKIEESLIGADMKIDGNIAVEGQVRLDGTLIGDLQGHSVVIGRKGELRGTISAKKLVVEGAVFGSIDAQTVTLENSARVFGDVRHEVLEVAAGAEIEGQYTRTSFNAKSVEKVILEKTSDSVRRMQNEPPPVAPGRGVGVGARAGTDIANDTLSTARQPDRISTN